MRVSSGRSPASTLPPGNSQRPAIAFPGGRSASRTRPSASTRAQAVTRTRLTLTALGSRLPGAALRPCQDQGLTPALRPVVSVDGYVLVGEVAGEHPVAPIPEPERDFDRDLGILHVGGDRVLAVGGIALAPVRYTKIPEPDRHAVAVGRLAGLADGHDDATPVGVFPGNRGLDQGRIG